MSNQLLNQPIRVGNLTLKNRIVLPPIALYKTGVSEVTDELVAQYAALTEGGYPALVTLEHSFVSQEGQAAVGQVSIASDDMIPGLTRLVNAVHANGVPILAQLAHAGSDALAEHTGLPLVSSSAEINPRHPDRANGVPMEMNQTDIDRIIRRFGDAAVRAQKAGFDGVEIHSAHGYLLSQFYSPLHNKRTDEYGPQSAENRTRLHRQIIREIRSRVGDAFVVSLRLGAVDYREDGAQREDVPECVRLLSAEQLDMISISGGICDYTHPYSKEPGWYWKDSEAAKSGTTIPVMLTGGVRTGEDAERLLREGKADLIGIGRAYLRNHDLLRQMLEEV